MNAWLHLSIEKGFFYSIFYSIFINLKRALCSKKGALFNSISASLPWTPCMLIAYLHFTLSLTGIHMYGIASKMGYLLFHKWFSTWYHFFTSKTILLVKIFFRKYSLFFGERRFSIFSKKGIIIRKVLLCNPPVANHLLFWKLF